MFSPSAHANEQRKSGRMKSFQPAVIRIGDRSGRFHLLNISPDGAMCHMTDPPHIGSAVVLDFRWWSIDARVVWAVGKQFGIMFAQEIAPALVAAVLRGERARPAA